MKNQPVIITAIFEANFKEKVEHWCEVNGVTHQQFFNAALRLGASAMIHTEFDELRHLIPSVN